MSQTLREKTSDARRRHVLDAAAMVFAERGFHSATIRDVARQAGVADGTIYNVFENKAALLRGLLDPLDETLPRQAKLPASGEPGAFLENLIAHRWSTFTPEALAMLRVVLSEALVDPALRAEFLTRVIAPPITLAEPVISAMVEQGRFAHTDAAMTARVLTATMIGLVMLRLLDEPEIERRAEDVPSMLAHLLAEGLRPRSGETGIQPEAAV